MNRIDGTYILPPQRHANASGQPNSALANSAQKNSTLKNSTLAPPDRLIAPEKKCRLAIIACLQLRTENQRRRRAAARGSGSLEKLGIETVKAVSTELLVHALTRVGVRAAGPVGMALTAIVAADFLAKKPIESLFNASREAHAYGQRVFEARGLAEALTHGIQKPAHSSAQIEAHAYDLLRKSLMATSFLRREGNSLVSVTLLDARKIAKRNERLESYRRGVKLGLQLLEGLWPAEREALGGKFATRSDGKSVSSNILELSKAATGADNIRGLYASDQN